jgi:hypothetical protein
MLTQIYEVATPDEARLISSIGVDLGEVAVDSAYFIAGNERLKTSEKSASCGSRPSCSALGATEDTHHEQPRGRRRVAMDDELERAKTERRATGFLARRTATRRGEYV